MEKELYKIHKMSSKNRCLLDKANICGCFYCGKIFSPKEIVEWIWDDTAVCPYCGIDAVIAEGEKLLISEEYLRRMKKEFFKNVGGFEED